MSNPLPESDRSSADTSPGSELEPAPSPETSKLVSTNPSTNPPSDLPPKKSNALWSALGKTTQALTIKPDGFLGGTTKVLGHVTSSTGQALGGMITNTTKTLGTVIEDRGKQIEDSLAITTTALGETIESSQQLLRETVAGTGQAINQVVQGTGQIVGDTIRHTTQLTGNLMHTIDTNSELKKLTKELKIEWLLPILETVDLQGVIEVVQDLQAKYPQDSADALAHRLIQQKVFLVGGMGLASSLVPGAAAALFSFDMAGLALSQAELGYQIAAVYGLDLTDPARKGEVLAIFGAAMGTNFALKTGLTFALRNVPIAGGVVGASTNAMALYAVGYAACRFYESHGQPLLSESAAQEALEAGRDYLQEAQQQQRLVDQIIAHMVKASFPDRTWAETLPALEPYHLNPASLSTIEAHLNNPIPLADLLDPLSPDYGPIALAACQGIANADQTITPEEANILMMLKARYAEDLNAGRLT